MDIICDIIGHKLPYSWQLIHEIQLNKSFRFTRNTIITHDIKCHKKIDRILEFIDKKNQKELKESLLNISSNSENVLKKNILRLQDIFEEVVEERYNDFFDYKLFYQMITNNSYEKEQLLSFINLICEKANEHCVGFYKPLESWNKILKYKLKISIENKQEFLDNFAEVIFILIDALKEQRTLKMNRTLIFLRSYLKGSRGIEIERKEVLKALKSGKLKIDKLFKWLIDAKVKVKYKGTNSYDKVLTIHREAMKELFMFLSLSNELLITNTDILPEFMILDKHLLESIKNRIRNLSIIISIWFLIHKIVDKIYVNSVFSIILKLLGNNQEIFLITKVLNKYKKDKNLNTQNTIKDCFNPKDKGIRFLMSSRIIDFLVSKNQEHLHKSLDKIKDSLIELRGDFLFICKHYEKVYFPLYHSIIFQK